MSCRFVQLINKKMSENPISQRQPKKFDLYMSKRAILDLTFNKIIIVLTTSSIYKLKKGKTAQNRTSANELRKCNRNNICFLFLSRLGVILTFFDKLHKHRVVTTDGESKAIFIFLDDHASLYQACK